MLCEACKGKGVQDYERPTLCQGCGYKIRQADVVASNIYRIRQDMTDSGIPLGGGFNK